MGDHLQIKGDPIEDFDIGQHKSVHIGTQFALDLFFVPKGHDYNLEVKNWFLLLKSSIYEHTLAKRICRKMITP